MNREELKRWIKRCWSGDSEGGDKLLDEFDRLNKMALDEWERAEKLQIKLDMALLDAKGLREAIAAYLDSKPMNKAEFEPPCFDNHYTVRQGDNFLTFVPDFKGEVAEPHYWHVGDAGYSYHKGKKEDCPICKPKEGIKAYKRPKGMGGGWTIQCLTCGELIDPIRGCSCDNFKPLTQCPECVWGQRAHWYPYYGVKDEEFVIYERCLKCKGKGVL